MFETGTASDFSPHYFHKRVRVYRDYKVPTVIMSREAYAKMWLYVDIAPEEVGWMGTAKRLPNGDFTIEKVWLLKQMVTGVETTLTTDGLGDMSVDLLNRGDEGLEDWDNLRFWGHSHVRMGTSPSGRDQATMRELEDSQHPWFIRGIYNKNGKIEFTLYLYEENLVFEDAPWTVEAPVQPETTPLPEPVVSIDEQKNSTLTDVKADTSESATTAPTENPDEDSVEDQETVKAEPKRSLSGRLLSSISVKSKVHPLYHADVTDELRAEVRAEFERKVVSRWSSKINQPTRDSLSDQELTFIQLAMEQAHSPVSISEEVIEAKPTVESPKLVEPSAPQARTRTVPVVIPPAPKKSLKERLAELVEFLQRSVR